MASLINAFDPRDPSLDRPPASLINGAPAIDAAQAPTPADAFSFNRDAVADYVARQRAISEARGLWGPEGITAAGARDAGMQTAGALAMATTAPEGRAAGVMPRDVPHPNFAKGDALPPKVYRGAAPANAERSSMAPDGVYVSTSPEAAGQWGDAAEYAIHTQPKLLDLGNWNGPAKATVARYLGVRPSELTQPEFHEGAADMFIKNEGTDRLRQNGFDGYRLGQDAYLLGDLKNYAAPPVSD